MLGPEDVERRRDRGRELGLVPSRPADEAAWLPIRSLTPLVCAGALAIADGRRATPPWQMALGALALIHEAYHLRIWNHRLDEGRVNCQAIRHFKVGVMAARWLPAGSRTTFSVCLVDLLAAWGGGPAIPLEAVSRAQLVALSAL